MLCSDDSLVNQPLSCDVVVAVVSADYALSKGRSVLHMNYSEPNQLDHGTSLVAARRPLFYCQLD